jgi:hypothetical protein
MEHANASHTHRLPAKERDLLRILCCVAWSDGDISQQERHLLEDLVRRYFLPEDRATATVTLEELAAEELPIEQLDAVAGRLESDEDRLLALKLAYMVIRVSRRSDDASSINPQEKVAYRRLVEHLALPEAEVREAEWAAERELNRHSGLLSLLTSRLGALGAWPPAELLEEPGAPRL